ncbi:hypothetical protein ACHAWU_007816 [Discostella pseudostelligera]|uniref:Uncharacterized protein n=1 Tax=Discostella pseudostelligera TaxID=259834 RepID=A0ABD3N368_9STRA
MTTSGIDPTTTRGGILRSRPRYSAAPYDGDNNAETISFSTAGNSAKRERDNNHLSLKSTLHISEKGTPYLKEISGSGPDNIVDADSVIAFGVMGEDGQQVRFCEYVDDNGENGEEYVSSSRDRLDQRINFEIDEDDFGINDDDNSAASDGSSSLGSNADEEILHELGLSGLILDDGNFESEDAEATIALDSKNLRSFRILWELLSRWATPSTVELVLHFQGNRSPSPHQDLGSSTNPPLEQCTTDVETSECSRNSVNIGASRQASIMSMLKMHIPRSLSELMMMQRGTENRIDQRKAEQRLADLIRTFDPSAPAADLNMKYWKGLTTILIVIAFPCEYPTSSAMDEGNDLLPPSIRTLSMASSEFRYLTRSVFSSLSGIANRSTDEVI